ncbi:DUF2256 domain-containing protein [Frigidibacter sp. MR17.24]|uniref:DUF2256 domain-containing protein n=1 Tax=Frigidibacter sp. MR17.24 TaxID=3127345 RepID=UPI003013183F
MRRKSDLPSKHCPVCGRPFLWRRKWARDWQNVIYCSERCRRAGKRPQAEGGQGTSRPPGSSHPS